MKSEEEKIIEEQHEQWSKMREQIKAIAETTGFKEIVAWLDREEQSIDSKLPMLRGQELEVSVMVRQEVRRLQAFLKNITKDE